MTLPYKEWLDNEYRLWGAALSSSTVHNFKEHPQVKRMLGEIDWPKEFRVPLDLYDLDLIHKIDSIGWINPPKFIPGACWRMIYYAQQVLKRNPLSIVEIGGGVGEFYAILRALGYQGEYFIMDFTEVMMFQQKYLQEVEKQTGLQLPQNLNMEFCVSFYALGEFDDELKKYYIDRVVSQCLHGFILWNPHSGASLEIPFRCEIKDEYPMLNPDCKQLEW